MSDEPASAIWLSGNQQRDEGGKAQLSKHNDKMSV